MKIYKVDFEPLWPVGCHLIIAAKDEVEALFIAEQKVYTEIKGIEEVDISESCVISFDDGNY